MKVHRRSTTTSTPRQRLLLATLLVLAGWFVWTKTRLVPQAPLPSDLARLEPQLRIYVNQAVASVNDKPRDGDRHATLGIVYAANGLWSEARQCFSNVVQLQASEPLGHLYAAIATQELGEINDALEQFRAVTVQFTAFPQGFYRLGDALLRAGDAQGAVTAFQRLIELAPNEWRGYAGLGDAKLHLGELPEAARLLERAIEIDPDAKVAHHLLGLTYRALNRMEDSERELNLGLHAVTYPMPDRWSEAAPQHMKLLQDQFEIANEHAAAGQPEKAIELLETARVFHPTNVSLLNNLAVAYLYASQPDKARSLAEFVQQIDTNNLSAAMTISASCLAAGENERALAHAVRVIALEPKAPQGYVAQANALLALEQPAEAVAALKQAAQFDPRNAQLRLELGDLAWRNLQDTPEALRAYEDALSVNPAFWPAHLRIAELHMHAGELDQARAAVGKARKIVPTEPAVAAVEQRLEQGAKR